MILIAPDKAYKPVGNGHWNYHLLTPSVKMIEGVAYVKTGCGLYLKQDLMSVSDVSELSVKDMCRKCTANLEIREE